MRHGLRRGERARLTHLQYLGQKGPAVADLVDEFTIGWAWAPGAKEKSGGSPAKKNKSQPGAVQNFAAGLEIAANAHLLSNAVGYA